MKDFLGKELAVGDWVVTTKPSYRDLMKAQVTKIGKAKVSLMLEWPTDSEYNPSNGGDSYWSKTVRFPTQVVKITR